jgi:hypothetical protein
VSASMSPAHNRASVRAALYHRIMFVYNPPSGAANGAMRVSNPQNCFRTNTPKPPLPKLILPRLTLENTDYVLHSLRR